MITFQYSIRTEEADFSCKCQVELQVENALKLQIKSNQNQIRAVIESQIYGILVEEAYPK